MSPAELDDREFNPVVGAGFAEGSPARAKVKAVAAAAYEIAPRQLGLEHQEFCDNFCHRPDCNLVRDYVLAEDDRRLSAWLDWQGHEPEGRAFLRLMTAMMRAGENIWNQTGITLFRQGQWETGPEPTPISQDALSGIAQLIGKKITVFYKLSATADEMKFLRFEP